MGPVEDADLGFEDPDAWNPDLAPDPFEPWPEELAGPEYWFWRRVRDGEDGGDGDG